MSSNTTFTTVPSVRTPGQELEPALTIAAHPDAARIGDRVFIADLDGGELARDAPRFDAARGHGSAPLSDGFVSRKAILLERSACGGVQIQRASCEGSIEIGNQLLGDNLLLTSDELERGVTITPSRRVVLVAHLLSRVPPESQPELGFVGESEAMRRLREHIQTVVDLAMPVLVRGESGSGKELVANALHTTGPRQSGPLVAVNMAGMTPSMAGAELFGYVKGAFTGATQDHDGYFVAADGGTLFLDEIGDAPADVQAMLLRTLETGEICPIGTTAPRAVDVRLVAATDAALEDAIDDGSFREPLYHRLASYQLEVPPLRARRDDIGRLLVHFLRAELDAMDEVDRLEPPDGRNHQWLRASLVQRLVTFDWPGNVRQLRNAARHIAISGRGKRCAELDPTLERMLAPSPEQDDALEESRPATSNKIDGERLVAALRTNRWQIGKTAAALGIARSTLYRLIDKSDEFRKAKDIAEQELERVRSACDGDLAAMAEQLKVSPRGLRLRMRDLGMS